MHDIQLTQVDNGVAITYDATPLVLALGSGIPLHHRWWWSFDGSLRLIASTEEQGQDALGDYVALVLTYADTAGPLVQPRLHNDATGCCLLVAPAAPRVLL